MGPYLPIIKGAGAARVNEEEKQAQADVWRARMGTVELDLPPQAHDHLENDF